MSEYERTPRNKVKRHPDRASYDVQTIYSILDAAPICHVAFVVNGQPFVIPTQHARVGDVLLLHGSPGSRLLRHVQAGNEVCCSFTLLDGLVVAKSIFHHSLNYRSAIIFGKGRKIEGEEELLKAMEAFSEKILPGRWREARTPNHEELKVTSVAAIDIVNASAKQRIGPPVDDPMDAELAIWNGVVPLKEMTGSLESQSTQVVPPSVQAYIKKKNGW